MANAAWLPYRWELVLWLWVAFFFNQADRQLFGIVLPALKLDLHLTDVQAGLVATIFTATFACVIPFSGIAGDVFSRKRIVVWSILLWSVATTITGFANTLILLIIVRSLATSVGEALFAPSAYALIGEQHTETRAQAMALHQTALYIGVIVTGGLAGYVADHFGWRSAFWIFGLAGIGTAWLMHLRIHESAVTRKHADPGERFGVAELFRTPTVFAIALGLGSSVFANVAYLTWMPTYLHERFGLSLAGAGFSSMFFHHAFAFGGVLIGGRIADRLAILHPRVRLAMQGSALLLAAPFLFLMGTANSLSVVYVALAGFGLFRGLYDCNTYAALYQVVRPNLHSSASGLVLAVAFAIGSLAPLLLGAMKQTAGLGPGLSYLSLVHTLGGAILFISLWAFFGRDYKRMKNYDFQIVSRA